MSDNIFLRILFIYFILYYYFLRIAKTSQYLCDKWDVNSREELVRGIINTIKATMIISKQFQLSLRRLQNPPDHSPPPSKIPIILFLACCWIQSVKEGLSSSLSSPFLSSSQLSLFELILSTIRSNATPSLIVIIFIYFYHLNLLCLLICAWYALGKM